MRSRSGKSIKPRGLHDAVRGSSCKILRLRVALLNLLDFLDERRNDRCSVFRVMKLQMHAPADKMYFEHRTAPCGT